MTSPWSRDRWAALASRVRTRAGTAPTDSAALDEIRRGSRSVLRSFSSSFFLVTRFLPAPKRRSVELVYAAVRYPDEIVDTFPIAPSEKLALLDGWQYGYEEALRLEGVRARLRTGVPWILAGFAEVVGAAGIPPAHYRSFLDAMRRDAAPRPFANLDRLIEDYVYGSAIVVGYFLAHVYGTSESATMEEAYRSAADLGIALQLTNFARDAAEDRARGRLYVPLDAVEARGIPGGIAFLAEEAEIRYERALRTLGVFAADTRPAIRACIDVYRLLNRRILHSRGQTGVRHSVPIAQKFGALPADKYWRVPLAWMGAL